MTFDKEPLADDQGFGDYLRHLVEINAEVVCPCCGNLVRLLVLRDEAIPRVDLCPFCRRLFSPQCEYIKAQVNAIPV